MLSDDIRTGAVTGEITEQVVRLGVIMTPVLVDVFVCNLRRTLCCVDFSFLFVISPSVIEK